MTHISKRFPIFLCITVHIVLCFITSRFLHIMPNNTQIFQINKYFTFIYQFDFLNFISSTIIYLIFIQFFCKKNLLRKKLEHKSINKNYNILPSALYFSVHRNWKNIFVFLFFNKGEEFLTKHNNLSDMKFIAVSAKSRVFVLLTNPINIFSFLKFYSKDYSFWWVEEFRFQLDWNNLNCSINLIFSCCNYGSWTVSVTFSIKVDVNDIRRAKEWRNLNLFVTLSGWKIISQGPARFSKR